MSDVSTVKCDVCLRQKQETNHWIVAIVYPGLEGIMFVPAEAVEEPRRDHCIYQDLCGQDCAHKRLSAWLSDLKNIDYPPKEGTDGK